MVLVSRSIIYPGFQVVAASAVYICKTKEEKIKLNIPYTLQRKKYANHLKYGLEIKEFYLQWWYRRWVLGLHFITAVAYRRYYINNIDLFSTFKTVHVFPITYSIKKKSHLIEMAPTLWPLQVLSRQNL